MTINSRKKGIRGESKFRKLVEELTGIRLSRNQQQSDGGGYDLVVDLSIIKSMEDRVRSLKIDEYAIEIKNTADGYQPKYWRQAVNQAVRYGRKPMLAYNVPTKGFRVVVVAGDLFPVVRHEDDLIHLDPVTFFRHLGLLKETKDD